MQPSPYTPGSVARPLVGRHEQLAEVEERLSYCLDLRRLVPRVRVDVAPRGLGKTSLLREMQRRADARGALTVWVTAGGGDPLVTALADEIRRRSDSRGDDAKHAVLDRLDHATITANLGVAKLEADVRPPAETTSDARSIERLIRRTTAAALRDERTGLVLFVDEIQAADTDGLRGLSYAWQHLQSEGDEVPAALFTAGLTNSPEALSRAATFTERYDYHRLGRLSVEESTLALALPAGPLAVGWERDALTIGATAAEGYPYLVQLIGDCAWSAAGRPDRGSLITAAHATRAVVAAAERLEVMFRSRWVAAASGEQRFMAALAALGDGPVRRADLAARLGTDSDSLSVTRQRLLDKGLIEVPAYGQLEFTIPGFAAYVRDR